MSTANFFQIKYQGINLPSNSTSVAASAGDIAYNSATSKFDIFTTASDNLVTEITTQTLTNKTINASSNTISNIVNANLSGSAGISNANLAAMAANTVKANTTGSSATPSDVALGTVSEATSSVLTLSGWTDATIGSPTIQVKQASGSQSGYLSSTDWNTFNGKQSTGNYATSGSGDVSWSAPSGAGPVTTSLVATSNSTLTTLSALSSVGTITSGVWNGSAIPIANGGTGQATAANAFNALAPATAKGGLIVGTGTNTYGNVAAGTTNQVLAMQSNGTWAPTNISALPIPQGTKNYLSQYAASNGGGALNPGNGNFELGSTTGWSLAHSTLSGVLPTSVASAGSAFSSSSGGSAASGNLSLSVVSSGQLSGAYSGSLASSAASVAGDMLVSNAFYIDNEDKAKVQTVKLYYSVPSGATNLNFSGTSSNSFAVWIYDVTNAAWIMPAGVYNLVQNSGAGYVTATFQTTSNSTQYQLALININASAGAYTLYVDDVFVGPQTAPSGPAMTDSVAYTPTFTGFGAISGVNFSSSRRGDKLFIYGEVQAGTPTAVLAQVTMGYNGANANVTASSSLPSGGTIVGYWTTSGNNLSGAVIAYGGANYLSFGVVGSSSSGFTNANGNAIVPTSGFLSFSAEIQIAGWSSNTSMSSDTDTRVVAARYTDTSGSSYNSSGSTFVCTTLDYDTHAAYNTSTNTYTVPVSGKYKVSLGVYTGSVNWTSVGATNAAYLYKNGVVHSYPALSSNQATGTYRLYLGGTTEVNCNAGDTLYIQLAFNVTNSLDTTPGRNWVTFERLSGPAVVAATEVVASYCTLQTPTGTPSSSASVIKFTATKDTHNAYSSSTGLWTCPVSGWYQASCFSLINGSFVLGNYVSIGLFQNGSQVQVSQFYSEGSSASLVSTQYNGAVYCNAGDTLGFYGASNASGASYYANNSYYSIVRVGKGN